MHFASVQKSFMGEGLITVEVVYAAVEGQALLALEMPQGSTLMSAVIASDMTARFPELDLSHSRFGIFGKVVSDPEQRVLLQGDRVEIYRPLLADPMEVRRLRAERSARLKRQPKPI